jgi:hypothetical protein
MLQRAAEGHHPLCPRRAGARPMASNLTNFLKTLTWDDFRGPVPPNTSFAAATVSDFTVTPPLGAFAPVDGGFQLVDNLNVAINFSSSRSWKIDMTQWPDSVQQDLLDHEQTHYNISAVIARDLFIKLMSLKSRTFDSVVSGKKDVRFYIELYRSFWNQAQQAYDADTGHSQANVYVPSSGLVTALPHKGSTQIKWEGLVNSAFVRRRNPPQSARNGIPYKMELVPILVEAGVTFRS